MVYGCAIVVVVTGSITVSCCLCVCFNRTLGGWAWFFLFELVALEVMLLHLGGSSPKGSWGGFDVSARASG